MITVLKHDPTCVERKKKKKKDSSNDFKCSKIGLK